MNANLHLAGDSLAVRDVSVSTVDGQHRGHATLQGWLTFRDIKDPRFDLTFRASELHALSNPRVADMSISTVERRCSSPGGFSRSQLTGAVSMDRGVIYIPDVLTQKNVVNLDDPEFFNVVDTSLFQNRLLLPEAPPRLLQDLTLTDVRITLGNEVWLKSSETNVNLSTSLGPLIVTTAPTGRDSTKGLALTGALVAERGDYRLNLGLVQRTFAVERGGTVRFDGAVDINPDLSISGLYTVRQPRTNAGNTHPRSPDPRLSGWNARSADGDAVERRQRAATLAVRSAQLSGHGAAVVRGRGTARTRTRSGRCSSRRSARPSGAGCPAASSTT